MCCFYTSSCCFNGGIRLGHHLFLLELLKCSLQRQIIVWEQTQTPEIFTKCNNFNSSVFRNTELLTNICQIVVSSSLYPLFLLLTSYSLEVRWFRLIFSQSLVLLFPLFWLARALVLNFTFYKSWKIFKFKNPYTVQLQKP